MNAARWLTLAVVSAATAMLLLDVTVVNVALPAIQSDLDASFAELQWVVDAYALTLAATLLTAGALADRHGRRAVFAAGLVLFSACSALCAAAGSGLVLDLARAAQGIGAAAMFAASLALLANEFQGAERAFALGIWGAITGAALAIGPLVGGLLVDGPGWRWVFLINLPLGAVLTWLTLRSLPESRDPSPRGLDLPGLVSFGAASFLGTLGLIRGNEDGWTSAPVLGSLAASAVLLACFVAIERRAREPMLAPALFRIPAFTGTAVVAFAQSVALYPLFLFLAVYLQEGLAYSATETGLRLLPLTLVLLAVAPISGRLTGRIGLRAPLVTGLALIAVALLLMRGLETTSVLDAPAPWLHRRRARDRRDQPGARGRDGRRALRRAGRARLGHQQHLPPARDRGRHRGAGRGVHAPRRWRPARTRGRPQRGLRGRRGDRRGGRGHRLAAAERLRGSAQPGGVVNARMR